ncbi:twinfilin-like [Condylostylus longicornis]|uniref:twinfilin-like n=1 Tax=Condylostylus longicornis TaxID=2530218 RepID=UPI00244E240F|nr:twinfilin-like [Condylostylus longicornis]
MSHQTGIRPNKDLQKVLFESKSGKYRAIKVSINNEELCCTGRFVTGKNSWEKDYDEVLNKFIEKDVPCYVLYRFDEKISHDHAWLLFTWIPDTASVRNKMLYASTKATMKIHFGTANISEEIHATTISELDYKHFLKSKIEKSPSYQTEELNEFQKLEITREVSSSNSNKTFGGLDFPVTEAATKSIRNFCENRCNYIQFTMNIELEIIDLFVSKNIDVNMLSKEILTNKPGYHLFNFRHFYEEEMKSVNIFIYSMPLHVKSIKEKMLYSSCKNAFIDRLMQHGVYIHKKMEIDDPTEVSEQFILDEVYPKAMAQRQQFAKPKGPPSRGVKRLTKVKD